MSRRAGASTAALLQRATSQLKGERVVHVSEEDDLNAYISSLTKRTAPKKSLSFDEDSDISISNEDFQYHGGVPVTASKYLKKKGPVRDSLDSVESIDPQDAAPQRFVKKTLPVPVIAAASPVPSARPTTARGSPRNSGHGSEVTRSAPRQSQRSSSALSRADALATKISKRPAQSRQSNVLTMDTDSEDSLRKPAVTAKSVKSRSLSPMRSASDSSISLARDGAKFVKRKKSDPPPPPDFLTSQKPATPEQKKKTTPVASNMTGKGSRKLVGNVMLSSEDESLAEFIEGLSGSELSQQHSSSPGKRGGRGRPVRHTSSPDSKPRPVQKPAPSTTPKPSVFKRTASPPLHTRSLSDDSLHSEPAHTHPQSASYEEDESFNVNVVMDFDTLGPVMSLDMEDKSPSPAQKKSQSATPSPSPFYTAKKNTPVNKKPSSTKSTVYTTKRVSTKDSKSHGAKPDSELFSNFGLHTVDELIGHESKDSSKELSVISDISEILTDKPRNVFRAKQAANVAEDLSDLDTKADVDEQYSYSEKFESISEKIGQDSSPGEPVSEVKTQYSDEDTKKAYSDENASDSDTGAESYSDSYTSNTESRTHSYTRSSSSRPGSPRKVEKKSVEVQTGDQPGLTYQWNTHHSGLAFMGPSFGMSFADPTPIAAHTVTAQSLEALTSYSPAMRALHDMLRQQLELTQTFIQAQQYLYSSYTRSIEPEHNYTTLEDTRRYIRKHRKPRLTFKEALKLVDRELS